MVSGTRINPMTEMYIKKFHRIMREKGFKMTSAKHSAQIEWQYEKEGSTGFCVWGWHGTGNYKGVKMIWGVTETNPNYKVLEDFSVDHVEDNSMSEESFKLYQQLLANIEKILKEAK